MARNGLLCADVPLRNYSINKLLAFVSVGVARCVVVVYQKMCATEVF